MINIKLIFIVIFLFSFEIIISQALLCSLLPICDILGPTVISTLTVLTGDLNVQALLTVVNATLSIPKQLLCNATIVLSGATLILDGPLVVNQFCNIVAENNSTIITKNGLNAQNLSFLFKNQQSIINWSGTNINFSLFNLTGNTNDVVPRFNFIANGLTITKSLTSVAQLAPFDLSVDFNGNFTSLSLGSTLSLRELKLSNSTLPIQLPAIASITTLTLFKSPLGQLANSLNLLNTVQSSVTFQSLLPLSVDILNAVQSTLHVASNTVIGGGTATNSPIDIASSSVLKVTGTLKLLGNAGGTTVNNLVSGVSGVLSIGPTSNVILGDMASAVYRVSSQLQTLGGSLTSPGGIQIAKQLSPLDRLVMKAKSLQIDSGNVTVHNGSLSITDSISFTEKGGIDLVESVIDVGGLAPASGGSFADLVLNQVDLTLDQVTINLQNLILPNRLNVGVGSTVNLLGGLNLLAGGLIGNVLDTTYTVIYSMSHMIGCNGVIMNSQPLDSSSTYQFVCDNRLILVRLSNCTGYRCPDGTCAPSLSQCPNPILPSCQPNQLRCLDGCFDNITTCNPCPGCNPLPPYNGCPANFFQCLDGNCVRNVSECCEPSTCKPLSSLLKPAFTKSPVDMLKDMVIPIINENPTNDTLLNVYGYLNIPANFLSLPSYLDKITIKRLDDSYLDTVNGTEIWGTDGSFRDAAVSMIFDLTLNTLTNPTFTKPIQFELKIPNAQQLNLTSLCLFYINTTTNSWECMQNVTLTSDNTIIVNTTHFTSFGVLVKSWNNKNPKPTTTGTTYAWTTASNIIGGSTTSTTATSTGNGGSPTSTTTGGSNPATSTGGGGSGGSIPSTTASSASGGDSGIGDNGSGGSPSSSSTGSTGSTSEEDDDPNGISNKNIIIMTTTIVGGIAVAAVVISFVVLKTIKHGGLRYWWVATRTSKPVELT
eukprot:gene9990-12244_t